MPSTQTCPINKIIADQMLVSDNWSLRIPFVWQVTSIAILLLGLVIFALETNRNLLESHFINNQFSELQVISDRLTHRLQKDQEEMMSVTEIGLLQQQLDTVDPDYNLIQSYLRQQMQSRNDIAMFAVLSANGHYILHEGEQLPFFTNPKHRSKLIQTLNAGQSFASGLKIDTKHHQIYQWHISKLKDNQNETTALLVVSNLMPFFNQLSPRAGKQGQTHYTLMNHQGIQISFQNKTPQEPLPDNIIRQLWMEFKNGDFGSLKQGEHHYLYLSLSEQKTPVHLIATFNAEQIRILQGRYSFPLILGGILFVLLLLKFLWQRRQQLIHSEARMMMETLAQNLYQQPNAILLFDKQGHCVSINAASQSLLKKEAILDSNESLVWQFDRLFSCQAIKSSLLLSWTRHHHIWHGQLTVNGLEKHLFKACIQTVEISHNCIFYAVYLSYSSELASTQAALQATRALQESSSALIALDPQGKIINCNKRLRDLFTTSDSHFIGHKIAPYLALNDPLVLSAFFEHLTKGQAWEGVLWLKQVRGKMTQYFFSLNEVNYPDNEEEEPHRILTITPLPASLLDRIGPQSSSNCLPLTKLISQTNYQSTLTLFTFESENRLQLREQDEQTYTRHQLIQQIRPLLPEHSIIGQEGHNDEIFILFNELSLAEAVNAVDFITKQIKEQALQPLELISGVVSVLDHLTTEQIFSNARLAVQRAKLTNQPFALAFTRDT